MQAIILAAGMGKRLKELTQNNTKCMVKVNGVTLIDRMLHQIDRQKLSRIVIVVGYKGRALMHYIGTLNIETPIQFVENPVYDKTNNIYSLYLAKDHLLSSMESSSPSFTQVPSIQAWYLSTSVSVSLGSLMSPSRIESSKMRSDSNRIVSSESRWSFAR